MESQEHAHGGSTDGTPSSSGRDRQHEEEPSVEYKDVFEPPGLSVENSHSIELESEKEPPAQLGYRAGPQLTDRVTHVYLLYSPGDSAVKDAA